MVQGYFSGCPHLDAPVATKRWGTFFAFELQQEAAGRYAARDDVFRRYCRYCPKIGAMSNQNKVKVMQAFLVDNYPDIASVDKSLGQAASTLAHIGSRSSPIWCPVRAGCEEASDRLGRPRRDHEFRVEKSG